MDEKVQISTNWCLLRGKSISESLVIKVLENSSGQNERPSIDDIVSFEQSIHLQQPQDYGIDNQLNLSRKCSCDIYCKICETHTANTLTLVTDCQKLEMFTDNHNEYYNTFIGEFLDDFDGMKVYRYDIDVTRKTSQFLLKLIPRVPEIWIYGIQVGISNAQITDAVKPLHNIDLENVTSILSNSNHKLTPKAEECKSFIESYLQGNSSKTFNLNNRSELMKWPTELEHFKVLLNDTKKLTLKESNNESTYSHKIDEIKKYIDKAVFELENKFSLQLQALEKRQDEKLDKIIEMLTLTQNKITYK